MAARRGHLACVQALLEGGSAPNATNKDGTQSQMSPDFCFCKNK
jgi:ankyrin repeat protein